MSGSKHKEFFTTTLDPAELSEILSRIDENLALRSAVDGNQDSKPRIAAGLEDPPQLSEATDWAAMIEELRQRYPKALPARGPRSIRWIQHLLAAPVRFWKQNQIYVNRGILDALSLMRRQEHNLSVLVEYQARLHRAVGSFQAQVDGLFAEQSARLDQIAADQQRGDQQVAQLLARQDNQAAQVDDLRTNLQAITARQQEQSARLDQIAADQQRGDQQVAQLLARQDNQAAQVDDLRANLQAITARQQDQSARLDHIAADLQRCDQRVAQVDDLRANQQVITARQQEQSARLDQIAADRQRGDQQVAQLLARQDNQAAQVDDLRTNLQAITARQQDQSARLDHIAADLQRCDQRVAQVDDLRANQQVITARQQEQSARLDQIAADRQRGDQQVAQLLARQDNQAAQVDDLRANLQAIATRDDHQAKGFEQIVDTQRTQQERIASEQQAHTKWLELMAANQKGLHDWLDLTNRKLQMLALDVRERLAVSATLEATLPEPHILDPQGYTQKLQAMNGDIKVNLGCGEKPWPTYINVDRREVPDVDVVADARRLPFEPGTLAELASAHLVEHFREHQMRLVILPYWLRLLRKGGCLRIICPNWAAMLDQLKDGRMSLAAFKLITFGAQDYDGDDHFAMYTPETLRALLTGVGAQRVEVATTERMNGGCPEMELLAYF